MDNNVKSYEVDLSKLVEEVRALREQENTLKTQQEALNKAVKEGKITNEQYTKANRQLTNQLNAVKARITATSTAMKTTLNKSMKEGLERADGLGKAFQGVSSVISGNVVGAIGALKGAFSALGGPMGIIVTAITTLLAKLLPFQEMSEAIGRTFSEWGRDFKNFFGIADEIERATDATENFANRLERAKNNMESIKKKAQETSDAMNANSNLWTSRQGKEADQFVKSGNLNNLEKAVQLQRQIVEALDKEVIARVKAKEAEIDLAETQEQREKLTAELILLEDEMRSRLNVGTEVQAEQYRNELLKQREEYLKEINKQKEQEVKTTKQTNSDLAEREKAIRAIEDIEIQLIEDTNERQFAQIELNKQRALKAIDEVLEKLKKEGTLTEETETQLAIQKNAIKELAEYQASQVKYGTDVFKHSSVELDKQMEQEVELMKKHLSGLEKIKAETAIQLNALEDERIKALEKENEAYEKLIQQIDKANISEQDRLRQRESAQLQHTTNMENITANSELKKEKYILESNDRIKQNNAQMIKSWSSVGTSISSILGTLADQQEEGSKKQLRLQRAQIYIAMAEAMAQGISNAMELPFPANLIAGVATLAELVALFAQVESMKDKAQYANGGYVSGKGGGKTDSIDAKLSNGEYVVNQKSTQANLPLLESINRGDNSLAKQLSIALQSMPNPIVSVEQIEKQTTKYENTKVFSHI